MSRRRVVDEDELRKARKLRETFVDRPVKKEQTVKWHWPKQFREVGRCLAVMYTSDKWKRVGEFEDYKHVSEAEQRVYVPKGSRLPSYDGGTVQLIGPTVDVDELPTAFAELADVLGVQAYLHHGMHENPRLDRTDEHLFQIDCPRAKLGGMRWNDGGAFLVVYSDSGVNMLITGDKLDIKKDGVVG